MYAVSNLTRLDVCWEIKDEKTCESPSSIKRPLIVPEKFKKTSSIVVSCRLSCPQGPEISVGERRYPPAPRAGGPFIQALRYVDLNFWTHIAKKPYTRHDSTGPEWHQPIDCVKDVHYVTRAHYRPRWWTLLPLTHRQVCPGQSESWPYTPSAEQERLSQGLLW